VRALQHLTRARWATATETERGSK